MKYLLIISLCFINYTTYSQTNADKVFVDPSYSLNISASDVFAHIKYIPLETNKSSYFGDVYKLLIGNDIFFIQDLETDAILAFSRSGKYINKIDKSSFKEFARILTGNLIKDFDIDRTNRLIYILLNDRYQNLYVFDYDFNFLRTIDLPKPITGIAVFRSGELLMKLLRPTLEQFSKLNFVFDSSKFSTFQLISGTGRNDFKYLFEMNQPSFYPKENEFPGKFAFFNTSNDGTSFYYRDYYDYSFYEITKDLNFQKINIVLPMKNSLDTNFKNSAAIKNKVLDIINQKEKILGIKTIFSNDRYLYLLFSAAGVIGTKSNLLIDKLNNRVINCEYIKPDSRSNHLPLFLPLRGLSAASEGKFYGSIPSLELVRSQQRLTSEQKASQEKYLRNFFKTSTSRNNPVLIELSTSN